MTPTLSAINPGLHPKRQTILIGHQAPYDQLRQAFQSGAMPPVWLLTGERGIGKATLAYTMAREILAHEGQDPTIIVRQMV